MAAHAPAQKFTSGHGVPSNAVGAATDWYLDQDAGAWYQKVGAAWAVKVNGGSPSSISQWLISMTQGESYELTAITRDVNEVISSATVKWYDGSAGVFTTTATDAGTGAINAYTITHTNSGKTVTQAAMTRDAGGAVTVKPALTVA